MTRLLSGLLWASWAAAVALPREDYRAAANLPLSTSGRDIVDNVGGLFQMTGINWPGHQEAMIPEGLQYRSIKDIVSWAPRLGVNTVRLTYATKMIDDIYNNDPDQSLEKTLVKALDQTNGTKIMADVLRNNPQLTKDTTRLQVFDAVATEMAAQGVLLHLDNHMSEAKWCCGENDGNGWFGEKAFNVDNWTRGWSYIAGHAARTWPTFVSAGLRNELRKASSAAFPVDWYTWHEKMTAAASAVHQAAPEALIFFSGLDYDTWIDPIPLGKTLNGTRGTSTEGKTAVFNPADYAYRNKIVLEIHKYDFEKTQDSCSVFIQKWYEKGFQCLNAADPRTKHLFPMVLSEWGFLQDGAYYNQTSYNRCTIEMVRKYKFGWLQWVISGSYYTRKGLQDDDEKWGILNHEWSGLRSELTVQNSLELMVQALK